MPHMTKWRRLFSKLADGSARDTLCVIGWIRIRANGTGEQTRVHKLVKWDPRVRRPSGMENKVSANCLNDRLGGLFQRCFSSADGHI